MSPSLYYVKKEQDIEYSFRENGLERRTAKRHGGTGPRKSDTPARIAIRHRARYRILDANGERGRPWWRARSTAPMRPEWPAVGDWAAVSTP